MSFLTYRDLVIVAVAAAAMVLAAVVDHRWSMRHRRTDPVCSHYRQPRTRRSLDRSRGRSCPVCAPLNPRARR